MNKDKDNVFDNLNCETIEVEDKDGNVDYKCDCKKLSATTVIKDVKNLFS